MADPRLPDFVKAVIGSEDLQEEAVSCLNSPQDAFALAAHAYFVAKGFRLEGVNHEKLGTPASSTMHSVHNHSSTINHSPNANQTSLHQTNWLRQSPNYFHFNYSSNIPTTGDWSYDEDQARFKTSLDVTISKLSQRMVQVSVSGEVEDTSKDNDSDPESQTLDGKYNHPSLNYFSDNDNDEFPSYGFLNGIGCDDNLHSLPVKDSAISACVGNSHTLSLPTVETSQYSARPTTSQPGVESSTTAAQQSRFTIQQPAHSLSPISNTNMSPLFDTHKVIRSQPLSAFKEAHKPTVPTTSNSTCPDTNSNHNNDNDNDKCIDIGGGFGGGVSRDKDGSFNAGFGGGFNASIKCLSCLRKGKFGHCPHQKDPHKSPNDPNQSEDTDFEEKRPKLDLKPILNKKKAGETEADKKLSHRVSFNSESDIETPPESPTKPLDPRYSEPEPVCFDPEKGLSASPNIFISAPGVYNFIFSTVGPNPERTEYIVNYQGCERLDENNPIYLQPNAVSSSRSCYNSQSQPQPSQSQPQPYQSHSQPSQPLQQFQKPPSHQTTQNPQHSQYFQPLQYPPANYQYSQQQYSSQVPYVTPTSYDTHFTSTVFTQPPPVTGPRPQQPIYPQHQLQPHSETYTHNNLHSQWQTHSQTQPQAQSLHSSQYQGSLQSQNYAYNGVNPQLQTQAQFQHQSQFVGQPQTQQLQGLENSNLQNPDHTIPMIQKQTPLQTEKDTKPTCQQPRYYSGLYDNKHNDSEVKESKNEAESESIETRKKGHQLENIQPEYLKHVKQLTTRRRRHRRQVGERIEYHSSSSEDINLVDGSTAGGAKQQPEDCDQFIRDRLGLLITDSESDDEDDSSIRKTVEKLRRNTPFMKLLIHLGRFDFNENSAESKEIRELKSMLLLTNKLEKSLSKDQDDVTKESIQSDEEQLLNSEEVDLQSDEEYHSSCADPSDDEEDYEEEIKDSDEEAERTESETGDILQATVEEIEESENGCEKVRVAKCEESFDCIKCTENVEPDVVSKRSKKLFHMPEFHHPAYPFMTAPTESRRRYNSFQNSYLRRSQPAFPSIHYQEFNSPSPVPGNYLLDAFVSDFSEEDASDASLYIPPHLLKRNRKKLSGVNKSLLSKNSSAVGLSLGGFGYAEEYKSFLQQRAHLEEKFRNASDLYRKLYPGTIKPFPMGEFFYGASGDLYGGQFIREIEEQITANTTAASLAYNAAASTTKILVSDKDAETKISEIRKEYIKSIANTNLFVAPNSVKEFPLTTVQATLNEVVNTSFFSNQPRESEDIADVYTSIEAVDGLWGTLNKSVWNKIKQLTDDAPTNSGSISQEESSENSAVVTKTQEEDPLKESERKKTDLRESDPRGHRSASLAEPYAAADSSPSPAAHGAGTPSTPYGTPPPFTHTSQLRKLDSKLSSRRKSIEQQDIDMATKHEEDDSEAKGVKQHNVVSTDDSAKASKRYSDTPGVPVMPQHDPPLPLGGNTDAPRRPLAPTGDVPPGFEDEYEIQSSLRDPTVTGYGARPGFGDRDLYPPGMGPHPTLDPLGRPGLGPFPGSGGMHPTAGDLERMMGGRGRLRDDDDDEMNYFGGTRGPPGSRFDPTGPFGGPNSGFGSRGGNSRFGGGFL